MLLILEGLNGAGKSTVINRWVEEGKAGLLPIDLPSFTNPVRFSKGLESEIFGFYKSEIKGDICRRGDYIFAVYEMVAHTYKHFSKFFSKDIVIDRSFLSSYVYGSIDRYTFLSICFKLKQVLGDDFQFVLLNTPPDLCIKRREADRDGKDYAILDATKQQDIYSKMFFAVKDAYRFFRINYQISKEGLR